MTMLAQQALDLFRRLVEAIERYTEPELVTSEQAERMQRRLEDLTDQTAPIKQWRVSGESTNGGSKKFPLPDQILMGTNSRDISRLAVKQWFGDELIYQGAVITTSHSSPERVTYTGILRWVCGSDKTRLKTSEYANHEFEIYVEELQRSRDNDKFNVMVNNRISFRTTFKDIIDGVGQLSSFNQALSDALSDLENQNEVGVSARYGQFSIQLDRITSE